MSLESTSTSVHVTRTDDQYADMKYQITSRWLESSIRPGQSLLNVGCGGGLYNLDASRMGLRVAGFEPDPEIYALASARCASDRNIRLANSGLMEIDPDDFRSDYLVMHDVLEHIDDEKAAVRQLGKLLKPGGRGVISVPAMPSLFGYHDEQLKHFRRYTRASLRQALSNEFEVTRIRYFGMAFIPIVYWYSVKRRANYPHAQAGSGLGARVLATICGVENRLPMPLGTSLLAEIHKR